MEWRVSELVLKISRFSTISLSTLGSLKLNNLIMLYEKYLTKLRFLKIQTAF